jgi:hypothetical protein
MTHGHWKGGGSNLHPTEISDAERRVASQSHFSSQNFITVTRPTTDWPNPIASTKIAAQIPSPCQDPVHGAGNFYFLSREWNHGQSWVLFVQKCLTATLRIAQLQCAVLAETLESLKPVYHFNRVSYRNVAYFFVS